MQAEYYSQPCTLITNNLIVHVLIAVKCPIIFEQQITMEQQCSSWHCKQQEGEIS